MNAQHHTRHDAQHRAKPGKVNRKDRRAAIDRKHAFLTDALSFRVVH